MSGLTACTAELQAPLTLIRATGRLWSADASVPRILWLAAEISATSVPQILRAGRIATHNHFFRFRRL